jgi:inosine-uridine nucleoside N-ribohydrolase
MVKVHLDTDLGGDIDDLCALAMLLKWPEVEITGITTVAEEDGRRAGYTKYALQLAGRGDIPVAAGADVSLGCYRYRPGYPDEEEYWPEPVRPSPNALDDALELLKRSVEQEAVLVGIGPFTNFALLEKRYPGILREVSVYLMGGFVYPPRRGFPQWENDADYNVQVDVDSAKYVLEHCDPVLVPLTMTVETALRRAYLEDLRRAGALGELIARQAEAWGRDENNEEKHGKTCERLPDDILNFQHDPLTCAVALGWDGVKISTLPLRFEVRDGWLCEYVDDGGKPIRVVTEVEEEAFDEFWLRTVTS